MQSPCDGFKDLHSPCDVFYRPTAARDAGTVR